MTTAPISSSTAKGKEKVVSCDVKKQYQFEGFNISGEGPTRSKRVIQNIDLPLQNIFFKTYIDNINVVPDYENKVVNIIKGDCGLFVAVYAEFLSDGLQVPPCGIIFQSLRMRYASLLWNYVTLKAHSDYFSINEDIERPRPEKTKSISLDENLMVTTID
ncbi:hypothetical protein H5410_045535 [Solanum commersonii]|uniref:Ulp1 protease family, C-terminal catalytic domain containing protein n=1 Tax=Solanum commersonii TaxID=4109 RepID=A0A9J5XBW8_SOLCO|nr:hypothetical protein H5410_045535 [Solanum commersonii]